MEFEQIGKYKILGEIGQGAMGVVYKAHDPILNREVAIKTISASLGSDDDLRKRFHREAQAAARLNHPNIITVFDFGEEHGKIYMAMELLEGTDLKDVMSSGQLATLDDKLAIMEQILDGLSFAHAKEIVHRDLKPGNIHIQPNGQIKIMDFGLARLGSSEMTQAGVVMGTPNYMSPEQVLGEKVDSRSDIFAMGAVFYELLTTHKPFEAESMHGVLFQVVHKEPQAIRKWAPDLPPVLVQIVEKCLVKDKTKRFQNAGELREAMMVARQALVAGRISEATLDMESGKVFFDAEEFVDDGTEPGARPASWPPKRADGQWVEGTVALDQAPLEEVLDEPSPASKVPTLSGKSRTQVNRQRTQRGVPVAVPQPSRAPLYIGAAVLVVGVGIGALLWQRARTVAPEKIFSPLARLLVETQNEIAQNALDDKDYKKAIDKAQSTIEVAKGEGAPEDDRLVVQARKILSEARSKFTAIETAATETEDAFKADNLELAAEKLGQLIQLKPDHEVAKNLGPKLNQQFQKQVADARSAMEQSRDQADKVTSSVPAEYRAEGRSDLAKAQEAEAAGAAALKNKAYAQATSNFLEARDAFERSRRAVETKMADAAKKNAALAAQLKVPAEEAKTSMGRARAQAEQASAQTNAAARDEFNGALSLAKDADAALLNSQYPEAKKLFDQARSAFDRAKTAAQRPLVTPPPPVAPPPQAAQTRPPAVQTPPPAVPTPPPISYGPKVGRLQAREGARTNLRSQEQDRDPTKRKPPEVGGTMEFEVQPPAVAEGEPYIVKVFIKNNGQKPWKLKSIAADVRVNREDAPSIPTTLTTTDVEVGERKQVAEISGAWGKSIETWVLTVTVATDKGDLCTNAVAYRRGP